MDRRCGERKCVKTGESVTVPTAVRAAVCRAAGADEGIVYNI